MITAIYNREAHCLTIEGHAKSGEHGHDLVCASVSILAYTLAANVNNMTANDIGDDRVIELSSGRSEISVKPQSCFEGAVTLIFDAVCVGLELLAHDYPDNITYECI